MSKNVLEFKRHNDGSYHAGTAVRFCGRLTLRYLDVHASFDLHCATRPPSHDEYYILTRKIGETIWKLVGGPDNGTSPWPLNFDYWLNEHFKGRRVYVWAMG